MSKTDKKNAEVLAGILAEVKLADAAIRRTGRNTGNLADIKYEGLSDAVSKLYAFLRETPISKIERLLSI